MDLGSVLIGLAAFAAAVAMLFMAVTWLARAVFGPRRRLEAELGLEVLEGRLARGEITREEFEQARRAQGS
ncbi:MAG: SHOCT domain-containing protein [Chloroflexota bacterium]